MSRETMDGCLTQEEWNERAERVGKCEDDLKQIIEEHTQNSEDGKDWRQLVEDLRYAVAAMLYVGMCAAERCRFSILDSHPPDAE